MNKIMVFFMWLSISGMAHADVAPPVSDTPEPVHIPLIERITSLSALETSSLVQAGLQEKGFQIRFVQPVEKGLKRYQENPGYLRVIIFDPPTIDIPAGQAGDELHVFVPLRVAVVETAQGSRVSSMPYAKVAHNLSEEAANVMVRWNQAIESVVLNLPE